MALNANEQFASTSVDAKLRVEALTIQPKKFAAGSGTLAQLTPVAFNTSTNQWVVWATGGANGTGTISGFVWADEITLNASDEVLGNVLLQGKVHYDDIVVTGGTEGQLQTALRVAGLREKGIIIQGLTQTS